ncbi:MAG: preprotein translocase subunit YajC [Anaerovoracaceae bacterium]|jgi:preprotein translocase subunit YajC
MEFGNILFAKSQQSSSGAFSMIMLVAFIALMYFLLIRPQKKREKEAKTMRDSLKVGDEIITIGGIVGKIVKTKENSLVIQVGADKVKFEIMRWSVSSVVSENPGGKTLSEEKGGNAKQEEKKEEHRQTPKPLKKSKRKPESEEAAAAAAEAPERADEEPAEKPESEEPQPAEAEASEEPAQEAEETSVEAAQEEEATETPSEEAEEEAKAAFKKRPLKKK